jgi:type-F conjugative transfer system secretin TraK
LFVLEDKVTSLASNGRLIIRKDKSGGVLLNVKGKSAFTAFLSTEKGREFSLYITPNSGSGETVKLIPKTPAAPHYDKRSPAAARFEQSTPYRKAVITLLKKAIKGEEVTGYTFVPKTSFDSLPAAQVSNTVKGYKRLNQQTERLYIGDELAIRVLKVDNKSGHLVNLRESDFSAPSVRAVALEYRDLGKDEYVFVYEVINND